MRYYAMNEIEMRRLFVELVRAKDVSVVLLPPFFCTPRESSVLEFLLRYDVEVPKISSCCFPPYLLPAISFSLRPYLLSFVHHPAKSFLLSVRCQLLPTSTEDERQSLRPLSRRISAMVKGVKIQNLDLKGR